MADVGGLAKRIIANVERAIVGKRQQFILSLVGVALRGARPAGGRAGRRQDDARPGPGPLASAARSSGSSARPTCCRPT